MKCNTLATALKLKIKKEIPMLKICLKFTFTLLFVGLIFGLNGCASYTTPGGGVQINELAEADINELMSKEPAAIFPANISVARVQAANYRSHTADSFGTGRYSVVTTRDVEYEEDFVYLSKLLKVKGIAPVGRILLSKNLDRIKSLREASARLKADILLLYTFDTTFHAGEQKFLPLNVIALGFLKNKRVSVTTTASAALFDIRTEYLYGLAEATSKESKLASVWSSENAVDDLRLTAERSAFEKLLPEIEKTWGGVVTEYSK